MVSFGALSIILTNREPTQCKNYCATTAEIISCSKVESKI